MTTWPNQSPEPTGMAAANLRCGHGSFSVTASRWFSFGR
jgi:hypothetical protein